jgi:hypothetical protein
LLLEDTGGCVDSAGGALVVGRECAALLLLPNEEVAAVGKGAAGVVAAGAGVELPPKEKAPAGAGAAPGGAGVEAPKMPPEAATTGTGAGADAPKPNPPVLGAGAGGPPPGAGADAPKPKPPVLDAGAGAGGPPGAAAGAFPKVNAIQSNPCVSSNKVRYSKGSSSCYLALICCFVRTPMPWPDSVCCFRYFGCCLKPKDCD